jgi:hypothetical protein
MPACFGAAPTFSHDLHLEADVAIATGFDFQPLDDGNVLIEFFGDNGNTFNTQVVTADVMKNMAMVSVLTDVALRKGPQVAKEIMGKLSNRQQATTSAKKDAIRIAHIVDDRPCDPDGPHETVNYFKEGATASKWLANWIKEEIEDDDDDEDKRKRLLSLIEAGDFNTLFEEYQDDYDDGVLKLSVYQREVI